MKRYFVITTLLILSIFYANSQTFLESYKKYKFDKVDKSVNAKNRNRSIQFIKTHLQELDTIFKAYKAKTNFNFNTADSLYFIYDIPIVSPSTRAIMIWSGKDTLSYQEEFDLTNPYKPRRVIKYESFVRKEEAPKGFIVFTERDSVLKLISKKDFNTLNHLGDNQKIYDGGYYKIIIAYKNENDYDFETYLPNQFVIRDIYRKE
jgi:hypothetical protein